MKYSAAPDKTSIKDNKKSHTFPTVYTATGPIEFRPVRYAAAPISVALMILQETGKRLLDPEYKSRATLVAGINKHNIEKVYRHYEGCILASLMVSEPNQIVNFLREATKFISHKRDATGLESIFTSVLQSAWLFSDRQTGYVGLRIWETYVRKSEFAIKHSSFVFDAVDRTFTVIEKGDLKKQETDSITLNLIGIFAPPDLSVNGSNIPNLGGYAGGRNAGENTGGQGSFGGIGLGSFGNGQGIGGNTGQGSFGGNQGINGNAGQGSFGGFGSRPGIGSDGRGSFSGTGLGGFGSGLGSGSGIGGLGGFGSGGFGSGLGNGGLGNLGAGGFESGFGNFGNGGIDRNLLGGVFKKPEEAADGWDVKSATESGKQFGVVLMGGGISAVVGGALALGPTGGASAVAIGWGADAFLVGAIIFVSSAVIQAGDKNPSVITIPTVVIDDSTDDEPASDQKKDGGGYPVPDDYYPSPDDTGGGGPHSAGIFETNSIRAFGSGILAGIIQVGAKTYRI